MGLAPNVVLLGASGLLLIRMPFVSYRSTLIPSFILIAFVLVFTVTATYIAWRRGFSWALNLLVAWALLLCVFATTRILVRFGFVPSTPLTENSYLLSLILIALLLALLLADRINQLYKTYYYVIQVSNIWTLFIQINPLNTR